MGKKGKGKKKNNNRKKAPAASTKKPEDVAPADSNEAVPSTDESDKVTPQPVAADASEGDAQKETKEEWCARVIKKQGDYDAKHYNYWKQALAKRFRSDSPRESSGVPEDEWKRYFDDVHKRHYWHNHGTSESLWDRPESDDAPARVLADEAIFIKSEDSGSDWD